ncbi:GNAT family N-acetyltransferase [Kushneria phosphatilytica]|uniref:GNAT family N-acetyltransferase n=1 Tax=Kushneria phosphatilytica TaxID=657387 RepID=A0A1S1NW62_9GAMM|nr:GNAT family protein [Kushneria phosphatilytica]OHV11227.1 hypothetical protein BH688_07860 [Kushneria phosphatilytica]QEL12200.1 GNAT family N-acetyltransferase [Kushneria phosphatilytica]
MTALPACLVTDRLTLLPISVDDAEALHAALFESMTVLMPWLAWASPDSTLQERRDFCRQAECALHDRTGVTYALWPAVEQVPTRLAGVMEMRDIDWQVPAGTLGYWCHRAFQGQGLITEALQALSHALLVEYGFQRLALTCDERNLASRRVAERSGYRLEGIRRHDCRDHFGELRNTCCYARLRGDEG